MPRYRSVERALALAVASAAGFAVIENIAYTAGALDESVGAARRVLFERSAITPFGHLAWTAIAVIVAARAWVQHQHVVLRPRALWGLALAIALHTAWNLALVEQGWWHLLVIAIAAISFGVLWRLLSDVYYDGVRGARRARAHRGVEAPGRDAAPRLRARPALRRRAREDTSGPTASNGRATDWPQGADPTERAIPVASDLLGEGTHERRERRDQDDEGRA